jgi:hypothetical protein
LSFESSQEEGMMKRPFLECPESQDSPLTKKVAKASNQEVGIALLKAFAIVVPFLVPGSLKSGGVAFGSFALMITALLVGFGGCLLIDTSLHYRETNIVMLALKARGEWASLFTEACLFFT